MSEINLEQEMLVSMENDLLNPELVMDNQLCFWAGDKLYRSIMPSQKDLVKATEVRNQKYVELSNQPNTIFEKELIKNLKKNQGIDIIELNLKIEESEKKLKDFYLSLAEKRDNQTEKIAYLKKELEKIKNERIYLIVEKTKYLAPAIENQCEDEYYRYLSSVCTEVHETLYDDKKEPIDSWTKKWKSFEEYNADTTVIPFIALSRLTKLILNG